MELVYRKFNIVQYCPESVGYYDDISKCWLMLLFSLLQSFMSLASWSHLSQSRAKLGFQSRLNPQLM